MKNILLSTIALGALISTSRADVLRLTTEAPGIQTPASGYVENFNGMAPGIYNQLVTPIGTYAGVQINPADQYGGSGGTGNYAVAFQTTPYTLTLSQSVNYFGFWLSALDPGNVLTFYENGVEVGQIKASDFNLGPAYYGNHDYWGTDAGEPFFFVNIFDTTGSFNQVSFSEFGYGGGYESDNHTVGVAAPEASTWVMMLLGFAGLGIVGRRRRQAVAS